MTHSRWPNGTIVKSIWHGTEGKLAEVVGYTQGVYIIRFLEAGVQNGGSLHEPDDLFPTYRYSSNFLQLAIQPEERECGVVGTHTNKVCTKERAIGTRREINPPRPMAFAPPPRGEEARERDAEFWREVWRGPLTPPATPGLDPGDEDDE